MHRFDLFEGLTAKVFCLRNKKQNSKSFFNYDANLTSVVTMETLFCLLL